MGLVMRKGIVFRCVELIFNMLVGVCLEFRDNIEELIAMFDYLRIVDLFLVVCIVKNANFDNDLEKNGIKVEQIEAFFEVEAIEGKVSVDSLYIFYQTSSKGKDCASVFNEAFHFLLKIIYA